MQRRQTVTRHFLLLYHCATATRGADRIRTESAGSLKVPGGIPYDMPKFSAMVPTPETNGDFEEMCMPAGERVRVIKRVQPAANIVVEMMEDARAALEEQFPVRSFL